MKTIIATILGAVIYLSTIPQSPVYAAKKEQATKEQRKKEPQKQQPAKPAAAASHHSSSSSSCSECCKKCALPLVAACANTANTLALTTGTTPILFEDNVFPPVAVQHPVMGNTELFRIRQSGVYLIEWSTFLSTTPSNAYANVNMWLRNVSTDDVIDSSEHAIDLVSDVRVVCGQCLVHLTTGTLIQLEVNVLVNNATLFVNNPTITFTLVARD